jgi:hypothetical protein
MGSYYQISLDINANGGVGSTMTLNTLSIYSGNTANRTDLTGATLHITLADTYTLENINGGSGLGDVQFFIPTSAFAGHGTYFTLFASISESDDGPEEFAAAQGGTSTVPDGGATVALLGLALTGMGMFRKFWRKN